MKIILPGWSNDYPGILTESAVCYAFCVVELLTTSSQIISQTYVTMPVYLACAVIFILLSYAGTAGIHMMGKKFTIPGFETGGG